MESVPDYLEHSPDFAFHEWAVNGKVTTDGLRKFVEKLSNTAFLPQNKSRDGWIEYQMKKIESLFAGDEKSGKKISLSEDDFTNKVLKYASSLNLFRSDDRKRVAVLGAGAFGIAMAVAISGGNHNVRHLPENL